MRKETLLRPPLQNRKSIKETLKKTWKEHMVARIAIGSVLAGGAIVAGASGAWAIAAWCLIVRSAMGAFGGYMASEGVFDYLQKKYGSDPEKEKKIEKSRTVVSITTAAVFAVLGGSHMGEALAGNMAHFIPETTLHKPPNIPIQTIFEDIRHDHPGQHYVTLEQAARRIEWLKSGISLDQSEKLQSMNGSVHALVTNPNGKIASSMKELGYLQEWWSVDQAARKLDEWKIRKILESAYGSQNQDHHSHIPMETVKEIPSAFISPAIPTAGILGVLGMFAFAKARRKREKNAPNIVASEGKPPASIVQSKTISDAKDNKEVSIRQNMQKLEPIVQSIMEEFWFTRKASNENSYELGTLGGKYELETYRDANGNFGVWFQWCNGKKIGYQNGTVFEFGNENLEEIETKIKESIEDLFTEAIVNREITKQREMRDIHTFEIERSDLVKIHAQLESSPDGVFSNETGGNWMQSIYELENGTFRFHNLNNPLPDEILATPVSFMIRPEKAFRYVERGFAGKKKMPKKESELIDRLRKTDGGRFWANFRYLTGTLTSFNWHKHPGGPIGPSRSDVEEAIGIGFPWNPGREIWTWWIANEIPSIPKEIPPNTLIFHKEQFGGKKHYMITFWKLLRPNRENPRPTPIPVGVKIV